MRAWKGVADALAHYSLWKAKPARRVYSPKASGKLRPLGILVIADRCLQSMMKNALEPAWEAKFEGTSYGFRPGRSGHDAIEKIFVLARPNKTKKWIFDADIRGAFDRFDYTDYAYESVSAYWPQTYEPEPPPTVLLYNSQLHQKIFFLKGKMCKAVKIIEMMP